MVTKDLVLYLQLLGIQGHDTVQDSSEFANHGAVKGNVAVVADETFTRCLSLNVPHPVGDHIIVPIKGLGTGNQAHTIEGWIYPNGYPPSGRSWPLLLGQVGEGSHHWLLHSDGTINLGVWIGASFGPKIEKEMWTHIAMVHDGMQLSCYINGTLHGTPKNATFNLTSTDLIIARSEKRRGEKREGEFDFSGKIANLRIYNRALSREDIQHDIKMDKFRHDKLEEAELEQMEEHKLKHAEISEMKLVISKDLHDMITVIDGYVIDLTSPNASLGIDINDGTAAETQKKKKEALAKLKNEGPSK